jgi:hypothetical protein
MGFNGEVQAGVHVQPRWLWVQLPMDAGKVSNHPVSSTLTIVATIAEQATRAVAVVTVCLQVDKGAGSAQAVIGTIACQQVD